MELSEGISKGMSEGLPEGISEDLFERVKLLIIDILTVKEDQITPESRLVEDLGADSLDVVDLIEAAQTEFDVEIKDEDIEGIKTIRDVILCVDNLLKLKDSISD